MSELSEGGDEKLYYEGAGGEALENYRKLTEEQKKALKKGDDIDEINTTDLEETVEDESLEEMPYDYLENNRVNLARAFLGKDGGYSVRKLKKFMKQDKEFQKAYQEAEQKRYRDRKAAQAAQDAGEEAEEVAPEIEGRPEVNYSDESDLDQALDNLDDETFQQLIDQADKEDFGTEEEAKAFFDSKLKEWSRIKTKKQVVKEDPREKTDPYYAMLKEDKPIASRFSNHFDLDDEDYHSYMDMVEASIGRYPVGFRHYENYENYRSQFPGSSIQEYHDLSKSSLG